MKRIILTKLVALALAVAGLTTSARAGFLLTIDLSNINNVTITATGGFAAVNNSSTKSNDGVDLMGFFNPASGANKSGSSLTGPTSTMKGGGASSAYNSWFSNGGPNKYTNLWIYSGSAAKTQGFTTTSAAFTGSMRLNLSTISSLLPMVGDTGNIRAGAYGATDGIGPIIGQWQVISTTPTPEPGTLALAIVGGVGVLLLAQCKRK